MQTRHNKDVQWILGAQPVLLNTPFSQTQRDLLKIFFGQVSFAMVSALLVWSGSVGEWDDPSWFCEWLKIAPN